MYKLIEEEEAIRAMQRLHDEDVEDYGAEIPEGFDAERAIEALKALPGVQSEITLESAIDYLHRIGWMQEHDKALTETPQNVPNDDLISRKAAIDAIDSTDWYHQNRNGEMIHGANSSEHQAWYKADEIHAVIDNLPFAQPEQKSGRWIDGHCSECGCDVPAYIEDWRWVKDMNAKFCPMCGARMKGGQDDRS